MYSIKKTAELSGIPAVTIRAWENRYGLVTPQRTNGGHRLYSQTDIDTLIAVKQLMEQQDIKISEAAALLSQYGLQGLTGKNQINAVNQDGQQSRNFLSKDEPVSDDPWSLRQMPSSSPYRELTEHLYGQLISLSAYEANVTLDLAFSLYHLEEVYHEVIIPVMYRIGREWEDGRLSVAQEHFASQLITNRCSQLLRLLPIQKGLPRAIALCPEGEHHHMGLMLFCLFLRMKGMEVLYLGPDTPLAGLDGWFRRKEISIAALSCTSHAYTSGVQSWMDDCLKLNPELSFVLGGSGFQSFPASVNTTILSGERSDWEHWFAAEIIERRRPSFQ